MLRKDSNIFEKTVDELIEKAHHYFRISQWNSACLCLEQAKKKLNDMPFQSIKNIKMAMICYDLGCGYFNQRKFILALQTYQTALSCYQFFNQLTDNDYRQQIKLCINMCDSYLALNQLKEANDCLVEAINLHKKIVVKNSQEESFKFIEYDPQKFYAYYEKCTSFESFIHSNEHIQQAKALEKYYDDSQANALFDSFEKVKIKSNLANEEIHDLIKQINQLNFAGNSNASMTTNSLFTHSTSAVNNTSHNITANRH